ncbi:hypothetical protein GGR54DRAFT_597150 [Hypoxylon sp. NC1633]|nr:hypothetical protein GGR54DRAFT_597150 [Hypoxylon sp. NC1633]
MANQSQSMNTASTLASSGGAPDPNGNSNPGRGRGRGRKRPTATRPRRLFLCPVCNRPRPPHAPLNGVCRKCYEAQFGVGDFEALLPLTLARQGIPPQGVLSQGIQSQGSQSQGNQPYDVPPPPYTPYRSFDNINQYGRVPEDPMNHIIEMMVGLDNIGALHNYNRDQNGRGQGGRGRGGIQYNGPRQVRVHTSFTLCTVLEHSACP